MRGNNLPLVVLLAAVTALAASDSQDYLCWAEWYALDRPRANACGLSMVRKVYLYGGNALNLSARSTDVVTISTTDSLDWQVESLHMPFALSGAGFCTHTIQQVFLTAQAAPYPATGANGFDLYQADYESWTPTWISRGHNLQRSRVGIAISENPSYVFLFGGVTVSTGTPSQVVEIYNLTSDDWHVVPGSAMPITARGMCDCVVSNHQRVFVLICAPCTNRTEIFIVEYDPKNLRFHNSTLRRIAVPSPYETIHALSLEHYSLVLLEQGGGSTSPTFLYYDLFYHTVNYVNTSYLSSARVNGSFFSIGFRVVYAGGVLSNGTVVADASYVDALPPLALELDRGNRSYAIGDNITIKTQRCYPGLTVRLATSPTCNHRVPGTNDVQCVSLADNNYTNGIAVIPVNQPVYDGCLCLSLGVCPTRPEQQEPCGGVNTSFYDCTQNYCCFDNNTQGCYKYVNGSDTDLYFILGDTRTFYVGEPDVEAETNAFSKFASSTLGILVFVVGSLLVCFALATFTWRRIITVNDDDGDDEGSSHPLDQHGKYKVICKLGQGGFGTVYLVSRKADGEQYAMKYIVCKDEEERNYAIKEFELLHDSQGHPNMIRLIEMFMNWSDPSPPPPTNSTAITFSTPNFQQKSGTDSAASNKKKKKKNDNLEPLISVAPRYVCLVMDYLPEGDLCRYILRTRREGGEVAEEFVLQVLARQVCSLLAHLHALDPPIVHRDLKPENVLLRKNATEVVLTDFGLAQQVEKSYMTTRAGSLHYVAPECWKRHYTTAVDMWALGCVMYGAYTGRVTADTARVMFSDARDKNFERDIRHDLRRYSPLVTRVIIGLLQTNYQNRLTSQQVVELLDGKEEVTPNPHSPARIKDVKERPQKSV